jgi:hypothetical protein
METLDKPSERRSGVPWLLALCFIGLAVLFRLAGNAVAGPAGVAAPASAHAAPVDLKTNDPVRLRKARSLARSPARTSDVNPDGYLLPGDNFSAIERRLADRVTYDPRALYVMYYATTACSKPVNPEWRTKSKTQKGRVFSAWKESFCQGRSTAEEATFYQSTMLQSLTQSRAESEKDDESANGTLLYFESQVYSDTPPGMAAGMLTLPDYVSWPLGVEDVDGTPYVAKLPRYQQVALEGIQCSQVGGCGPNDLMTMWLCLMTPRSACSSTTSADDMWEDEFSSDEIAIIARIQQRILDERARRVASSSSKD